MNTEKKIAKVAVVTIALLILGASVLPLVVAAYRYGIVSL